jgi:hypothetical protein
MLYQRYTPEQQEKIAKLRDETEKDQKLHQECIEYQKELSNDSDTNRRKSSTELEIGDRVYVDLGGLTVIGYLVELNKEKKWIKRTKTIKEKVIIETFDVSTPYGKLKNIERKNLRYRDYQDLSHVVIPEELKEIPTQDLLTDVRSERVGRYSDDGYRPATHDFSSDEIRAELRNRPNVRRNKKVKKILRKFM